MADPKSHGDFARRRRHPKKHELLLVLVRAIRIAEVSEDCTMQCSASSWAGRLWNFGCCARPGVPGANWQKKCMSLRPDTKLGASRMHISIHAGTQHAAELWDIESDNPTSDTIPNELRVGVQLAAPWACIRHGQVEGVEVDDARAFARWLGRSVRFVVLVPGDVSRALRSSEVDLVIGGVQDAPELADVALSCRYSERLFSSSEDRHGALSTHVWAMPRHATALYASLAYYLWSARGSAPARKKVRLN